MLALAIAVAGPASAQSWWPFGNDDKPPVPKENVYRDNPPAPIPPPPAQNLAPPAVPPPAAGGQPAVGQAASSGGGNSICLQLEQRLVQEGQKGSQWRDQIPKIEAESRALDKTYNVSQSQLDKSCYEYFLFAKTFRSTPQCKALQKDVDVTKRRLAELEAQRQDLIASGGRSYQDDIIRELARNNCGANYADQARRRSGGGAGGFWQDEESVSSNGWNPQSATGGAATYRTICVRLCDGYYFPVSFSTLPSHFGQDAESCQSRCAAPSELFYYPNPGGSVDQSVALTSQEPYTKQKFAFRYRKEYVSGCSCKEAEFVPAPGTEKKADSASGTKVLASPPQRRAEAPSPVTTGSTSKPVEPQREAAPIVDGWTAQQQ